MEDLPLVTIIIPVYKVESFIERCARSLYEQTYNYIEFIWVDDATPDGSIDILEDIINKYPHRSSATKVIHMKTNQGPIQARYAGISDSSGDYLYFCDGDDWVDKDMIQKLVDHAIRYNSDIVWCDFYRTYSGDIDVLCSQKGAPFPDQCIRNMLRERMHGGFPNKLFRKILYTDNRITFTPGANMCEDLRGSIQLFYYAQRVSYLPKAFYHYVQDNGGSLSTEFSPDKLSSILENINAIISFLSNKGLSKEMETDINYLKLLGKKTLLTSNNLVHYKQWRDLYSEANAFILSYDALPFHLRVIGWMSAHRMWLFVRLWLILKWIKNKYR